MFLNHKGIYLLTKKSRTGWFQAHLEAPLCHQGHILSTHLLCCPQLIDCLHLCLLSHLWSQDGHGSSRTHGFTILLAQRILPCSASYPLLQAFTLVWFSQFYNCWLLLEFSFSSWPPGVTTCLDSFPSFSTQLL